MVIRMVKQGFWTVKFPTVVVKILSDSGALNLKPLSGGESSSSGHFNPVGHLQHSGCLGSYPP